MCKDTAMYALVSQTEHLYNMSMSWSGFSVYICYIISSIIYHCLYHCVYIRVHVMIVKWFLI